MRFVHLGIHTEFSITESIVRIPDLVKAAVKDDMPALALTDLSNLHAAVKFYEACLKKGIKPILGSVIRLNDAEHRATLLAMSSKGWRNLTEIVSQGFIEGQQLSIPCVQKEWILEQSEDLIVLLGQHSDVGKMLCSSNPQKAEPLLEAWIEKFGNRVYLALTRTERVGEEDFIQQAVKLAAKYQIGVVAHNDVHFVEQDDFEAHEARVCIADGYVLGDDKRPKNYSSEQYFKTGEQMSELFSDIPSAIENTYHIAKRCNVEIVFGEQKVPEYDVPEGYTAVTYLNHLCEEGLKRRYPNITKELRERLDYELKTIENMGYVDYFLIVWDFIHYAKEHGIAVGPGRGSAAGSIVSYCLEITDIDPIRYQLLFERFLNPERVSMPDIDVDFCYERRQEVIDYVVRKYGKDQVVQIITFGTMAARAVIRDVGRVLDIPYAKVDGISKMVPNELNITIDKALKISKDLRNAYEQDEETHYLIDMSKRLEGLPRHASMHAAGVVIGKTAIDEYVPLATGADNAAVTQFTMTTIEELGLLKMDFLGLRTLTVIQDAEKMVRRKVPDFDITKIDPTDKEVYEMIGNGHTEGVFQLESSGMKSFMKELKPQNMEDIIAGISLYRPGPMDFIPRYIEGKNHQESIHYECEQMEEILEPTYGCIVYQEQVMQIVMRLAGYTLGRSDLVRRAMSKKKGDVMARERQNFVYGNEEEGVEGCIKRGIPEETANKIFDEMIDFAKYAFNKSHAAAYAVVSYQTAWLKYYYPVEFMAALMTSVIDNPGKVSEYIYSCRQMGIKILPPDINKGEGSFSVDGGNIRYGLAAIKSIGKPVIESIIQERKNGGEFSNLKDFIERLSGKEVNKRTIESFIKSGAFDSLGGTRKQFMVVYVQILDQVNSDLPQGAQPMRMLPVGLGMVRLHDAAAAGEVPGAVWPRVWISACAR